MELFKVVLNKLLWAISQLTAMEMVYRRADAALPLMGMQSFAKSAHWLPEVEIGAMFGKCLVQAGYSL